jgi:hypothetical protein
MHLYETGNEVEYCSLQKLGDSSVISNILILITPLNLLFKK